jgi:hypothetical protein
LYKEGGRFEKKKIMGIGHSRERYGQRREEPGSINPRERKYKRGVFRRRRHIPTISTTSLTVTQPSLFRFSHGAYGSPLPVSAYPAIQPILPPFLPISYNHYPAPSYMSPQYMMPLPKVAPSMPAPFIASPPISMPYMQPAQIQPVPFQPSYNNIGVPASMPMGMSGGPGFYPSSYPPAPARLITDWTGGGQISPGFLGPPI